MLLPSRTRPQIAGSMEKRGNGEAVKRRNGEVGKFAPSRFTHYELRITLPICPDGSQTTIACKD
jgi:hypothetical protein